MQINDLIADLLAPDSPPIRPDSPQVRPAELRAVAGGSLHSPLSPGRPGKRPGSALDSGGMRAYRVHVRMEDGRPSRWLVMLAPGCGLIEAQRTARNVFGPTRVLAVKEQAFRREVQS